MKKILSMACCVFCLHSFSQPPVNNTNTPAANGEKLLIKALTIIVNPDAAKKAPTKYICAPAPSAKF